MNKELIIENLTILRDAVINQPENLFDLSRYEHPSECGTWFCAAGLATTLDHFKNQGMIMYRGSENNLLYAPYPRINNTPLDSEGMADALF